ncbi:MAG: hypothetical protein V2A66_02180 [Pseudomonadota bacterium]
MIAAGRGITGIRLDCENRKLSPENVASCQKDATDYETAVKSACAKQTTPAKVASCKANHVTRLPDAADPVITKAKVEAQFARLKAIESGDAGKIKAAYPPPAEDEGSKPAPKGQKGPKVSHGRKPEAEDEEGSDDEIGSGRPEITMTGSKSEVQASSMEKNRASIIEIINMALAEKANRPDDMSEKRARAEFADKEQMVSWEELPKSVRKELRDNGISQKKYMDVFKKFHVPPKEVDAHENSTFVGGYIDVGGGNRSLGSDRNHQQVGGDTTTTDGSKFCQDTGLCDGSGGGLSSDSLQTSINGGVNIGAGLVLDKRRANGFGIGFRVGAALDYYFTSNPVDPNQSITARPANVMSIRGEIGLRLSYQFSWGAVGVAGLLGVGWTGLDSYSSGDKVTSPDGSESCPSIKTANSQMLCNKQFAYLDVTPKGEIFLDVRVGDNLIIEPFFNVGGSLSSQLYNSQPAAAGAVPDLPGMGFFYGFGLRFLIGGYFDGGPKSAAEEPKIFRRVPKPGPEVLPPPEDDASND